ncbi:MAG: peptide-methionine (S)-S-oxide reductase [Alteromonadaceae bacterium]|nr:peptide-methionine (S)-S-oxide reductase [Alteromonadaceae bacterium]|tara:strand:- start:1264 stop:1890 length:627 start_codon:yes stop_codon:yes gene_type:complete
MKRSTGLGILLLLQLSALSGLQAQEFEKATFAGGCFWCMEPPFDGLEGVQSTTSGYANGHTENPTYEQVTAGGTGHIEAMQVTYDPSKISYRELLEVYWPNTDPTDDKGQFCDRGFSYKPAIFYHSPAQEAAARESLKAVAANHLDAPIVTAVEPLQAFYPAEDYHQDYYRKNPARYKFYRWNCGRENRLDQLWGEQRRLDLFGEPSP